MNSDVILIFSGLTVLVLSNTLLYLMGKTADVRYVQRCRKQDLKRLRSIMTTNPERFAGYSAPTAITGSLADIETGNC